MLRSADELFSSPHEMGKLSFGCCNLDEAFGGGLPVHGIHEICGEAGCGKTQLSLQLALRACLPESVGGLSGRAVYLSSGEGTFPVKRLQQLARHAVAEIAPIVNSSSSGGSENSGPLTPESLMANVLIRECPSVDALMEVIENSLAQLMAGGNIRVVVIDSVAGAFRGDDRFEPVNRQHKGPGGKGKSVERTQSVSRARDLFLFASHLRRLSFRHHTPIIVVNQATAMGFNKSSFEVQNHDVHADAYALSPDLCHVKPALGLSWTTCVNTRIVLTRVATDGSSGNASSSSSGWRREAVLMLSSCAPCRALSISITPVGVSGRHD